MTFQTRIPYSELFLSFNEVASRDQQHQFRIKQSVLRLIREVECSVTCQYSHTVAMRRLSWLRYCASHLKAVGSIRDDVIALHLTMALGSAQSVTEMSTGNHNGGRGKAWPALKADKLTAIYVPTVEEVWEL
jgi:hypothetical protein